MITEKYTKPLSLQASDVMQEVALRLLRTQAQTLSLDYNRHTATTLNVLQGRPFEIDQNGGNPSLNIDYPATVRFLDLKKTATGKRKKLYSAIYNRPVFGHIYGRGYSLSNLLNIMVQDNIRQNISGKLQIAIKEI